MDDETLIAYLDGQLPEADYGPLEQALKDDEALRTRLQALADSMNWALIMSKTSCLVWALPKLAYKKWCPKPWAASCRSDTRNARID